MATQACRTATPSYSSGQGLSTSKRIVARDLSRPSQALVSSLGAVVLFAPQLPRLVAVAHRTISKYQSLYAHVQISLSDSSAPSAPPCFGNAVARCWRRAAHLQSACPNDHSEHISSRGLSGLIPFLLMFLVAFEDWYLHLGRRYFRFNHSRAPTRHRVMLLFHDGPAQYRVPPSISLGYHHPPTFGTF